MVWVKIKMVLFLLLTFKEINPDLCDGWDHLFSLSLCLSVAGVGFLVAAKQLLVPHWDLSASVTKSKDALPPPQSVVMLLPALLWPALELFGLFLLCLHLIPVFPHTLLHSDNWLQTPPNLTFFVGCQYRISKSIHPTFHYTQISILLIQPSHLWPLEVQQ